MIGLATRPTGSDPFLAALGALVSSPLHQAGHLSKPRYTALLNPQKPVAATLLYSRKRWLSSL